MISTSPQWQQTMIPTVNGPMPALAALNAVAQAAGAARQPTCQNLANICTLHDLVPPGYPQCTTLQQHITYVSTAYNSAVSPAPDWGRIQDALDHTGM